MTTAGKILGLLIQEEMGRIGQSIEADRFKELHLGRDARWINGIHKYR